MESPRATRVVACVCLRIGCNREQYRGQAAQSVIRCPEGQGAGQSCAVSTWLIASKSARETRGAGRAEDTALASWRGDWQLWRKENRPHRASQHVGAAGDGSLAQSGVTHFSYLVVNRQECRQTRA
jgi:hypothetical protein